MASQAVHLEPQGRLYEGSRFPPVLPKRSYDPACDDDRHAHPLAASDRLMAVWARQQAASAAEPRSSEDARAHLPSPIPNELRQQLIELLPRLRRFGVVLTGSKDAADDLVQATLERALSRFDSWKADSRLDSWMFKIEQNLWIDQQRAEKGRGTAVAVDILNEVVGADGRAAETKMTLERTRSAIAGLPEDQRAVIALVAIDGLSYREAAEVLDVPIGTIMSRLSRARSALATIVFGSDDSALPSSGGGRHEG